MSREYITRAIRVTDELWTAAQAAAKHQGRSASEACRDGLELCVAVDDVWEHLQPTLERRNSTLVDVALDGLIPAIESSDGRAYVSWLARRISEFTSVDYSVVREQIVEWALSGVRLPLAVQANLRRELSDGG